MLIKAREFKEGLSQITTEEGAMGMNFGMLKLKEGQSYALESCLEKACLLLNGGVVFKSGTFARKAFRANTFDDPSCALHLCCDDQMQITALLDSELIMLSCQNTEHFEAVYFDKSNIREEHRGQGLLDDTSYRLVRTIFDKENRPFSKLVLGEVVALPGGWSSYPPHHHPQPEIYHYRFSEEQGYGHGEMGDEVFKIKHNDTLAILPNCEHAQVCAPGYGMMYVWAIKHLPNTQYDAPIFNEEHAWTMLPTANERVWKPKF